MNFILLMAMVAVVNTLELTPNNYADETTGKTALILFYSPWCGHCKRIRPGWDRLMRKNTDESILIAEVDCEGMGKELCTDNGITGYPTIKYGNPQSLEIYDGKRDKKSIKKFISQLEPLCSPSTMENCDEEEKKIINKFMKMSYKDLKKDVAKDEKKMKEAHETLEKGTVKLQEEFRKLQEEQAARLKEIADTGIDTMKIVLKYKLSQKSQETPDQKEKKEPQKTPDQEEEEKATETTSTETTNKEEL